MVRTVVALQVRAPDHDNFDDDSQGGHRAWTGRCASALKLLGGRCEGRDSGGRVVTPPPDVRRIPPRALVHRIVEYLAKRRIAVVDVGVTTVKLWATGYGHASKTAVLESMQALWPHAAIGDNDNKSDALALATIGAQRLGWYEPELPHHLEPRVSWPAWVRA
ncbi:hypothetical protein [Rhodococcus daqingensis]|uniref:Uncharacterized protein n=1 Tax=Rhodococcus daqingensis TaxID=2479363 RepID=A0ABW2RVT5_9NOCA